MLELFHGEYAPEILRKNWEFYEPRTEHGSSLSACMYAMLATRFNRPDLAYPFFLKSARAELDGGGKQWAGLVYIGGTHPAAAGGAWKVIAQAFAGLHFKDGSPCLAPCLPESFTSLRFPFIWRGQVYDVNVTRDKAEIKAR
jgi:kojibiose phosphorylase/nigerose phosphorylase